MVELSSDNAARKETRSRIFWVGFICVLLSCQVMLMFVAVYLAVSDGSFAVEPDYYQKSLDWDSKIAQLRNNERLGWQSNIALGDNATIYGERSLTCQLQDAEGEPLDGAVIDVIAFPHSRGSEREAVTMTPSGEGLYETTMRFGYSCRQTSPSRTGDA